MTVIFKLSDQEFKTTMINKLSALMDKEDIMQKRWKIKVEREKF